jgi:hypothetical protein
MNEIYWLQCSDKNLPDNWITWRDMETSIKKNLKSNLKSLRKQYPDQKFRYIRNIQISYTKQLIYS